MKLRLLHTLTLSCVLAGSALLAAQEHSPSWKLTPVYTFMGLEDGSNPNEVILDAAGNLYGSAQYGGEINDLRSRLTAAGSSSKLTRGAMKPRSTPSALDTMTGFNRSAASFAITLALSMVPMLSAVLTAAGRCSS